MGTTDVKSIWEELEERHRALDERFSNLFIQDEENLEDLFKERAEELSTPPEAQKTGGSIYIVCLAGGEYYGFPVEKVSRIVVPDGYVPIPQSDSTFLGVISHMNDALPVLSLVDLLNLERAEKKRGIVIILEHGSRFVGCEVEGIKEIATIEQLESARTSKKHPVLKYIISYEESVLGIVDVPTLFSVISHSVRED